MNVPQLLEEALNEVYKLSTEQQNAIAAAILEQPQDEKLWEANDAASEDKLAKFAHKVRSDIKVGCVKKVGFDEL